MEESIAVKGEPVPNPMLGCGIILFLIGSMQYFGNRNYGINCCIMFKNRIV